VVEEVDVPALLRAWADGYDVFKRDVLSTFVAMESAASALGRLVEVPTRTLVTGSFAAVRLAPVAAPSMLAVYCEDVATTAGRLGLLAADEGANVTLLRPFDDVVWDRGADRREHRLCGAVANRRRLPERQRPDAGRRRGAACLDGRARRPMARAVARATADYRGVVSAVDPCCG
jgi:hypothetical protein